MGCFLEVILEYLIVFVLLFFMNYFMFLQNKKKEKSKKIPTELLYLKKVYGVNIKKISIERFGVVYSSMNAFIISTIYIILRTLLENWILRIVIGIVLLILMIIICYGFLGKYYLWKEGDK